MPIKGLTDERMNREAKIPGRLVRLGTIQKGYRDGFGKDIKLYDLDYLRFTPANGDERLTAAFHEVYGEQPTSIDDVRIPADMAGNFDILNCSWLVASKHTEKGSVFLARSDGENIKQARRESNGRKVDFFYNGEMLHVEHTKPDSRKNPGFVYKGNVYAWQQSFAIDLILPAFNRAVFDRGLVGYGAVTLITTSTNDIASLTQEYFSILEELAAPFINPLSGDAERIKSYVPLRNFPLRLYRQVETVGTPDYRKDSDPADRLLAQKSLLHWQVNPEFSASIQKAIDQRTAALIDAAAKQSFLTAGRPSIEQINSDLYADAPQLPERIDTPPVEYQGPDWESLGEAVSDGDFEEELPGNDPGPLDWKERALLAGTLDAFASAVYQTWREWFDDATKARKGIEYICGDWSEVNLSIAFDAVGKYVSALADGATQRKAADAAKRYYENEVALEAEYQHGLAAE